MRHVFVDTGVWYALIDAKDPDHDQAVACVMAHQGKLLTSNCVFDETVTLLRYRLGWRNAHIFGEQVRGTPLTRFVRVSPQDEDLAWDIFSKFRDKSFSFTDCTSFALMERLKIDTAAALDSDFKAYGLHCVP